MDYFPFYTKIHILTNNSLCTCRFVFPEGPSLKLTTENEIHGHTTLDFVQTMCRRKNEIGFP